MAEQFAVTYDIPRIIRDAAGRGWRPIDVIRRAKGVSIGHGYAFFRGEAHSPRVAASISKVLGKTADYYLIGE